MHFGRNLVMGRHFRGKNFKNKAMHAWHAAMALHAMLARHVGCTVFVRDLRLPVKKFDMLALKVVKCPKSISFGQQI
jgi:hypothetical protein